MPHSAPLLLAELVNGSIWLTDKVKQKKLNLHATTLYEDLVWLTQENNVADTLANTVQYI